MRASAHMGVQLRANAIHTHTHNHTQLCDYMLHDTSCGNAPFTSTHYHACSHMSAPLTYPHTTTTMTCVHMLQWQMPGGEYGNAHEVVAGGTRLRLLPRPIMPTIIEDHATYYPNVDSTQSCIPNNDSTHIHATVRIFRLQLLLPTYS